MQVYSTTVRGFKMAFQDESIMCLRRIWPPPTVDLNWPPAIPLTDGNVLYLADGMKKLFEGRGQTIVHFS
jgi:hypothetical protein